MNGIEEHAVEAPTDEMAAPGARNPPRVVALARLARASANLAKEIARVAGFAPEVDDALRVAHEHVERARAWLDALPENARPKKPSKPRGAPEIVVGAAYEIREKNRATYSVPADGDASCAIVLDSIDDKHVVGMFLNGNKASVRRTHLGKIIADV